MRKLVKIIFILALLSWAAVGFRYAQGQRSGNQSMSRSRAVASLNSQPHEELTVATSGGAFVLKNLTLLRMTGSTVLKGSVVNKSNHRREQISFEVRAYDRGGRVLKGLESQTIFGAHELKANASTPINQGYGVWLQGISLDDIARIEISEIVQEHDIPIMARMIPLAAHALAWQRYSEIEE
ncbi:MAG: hypothetical protein QOH25_797 [Acidobacteriota bacterium]|jgi:hypothetical protein|nr:hypothetical protein [Acidobacteriota bacterium]